MPAQCMKGKIVCNIQERKTDQQQEGIDGIRSNVEIVSKPPAATHMRTIKLLGIQD